VDVSAERYVFDGKFATAAGATAGVDLSLALVRRLAGDEMAREIQLQLEYDPAPPFTSGSPDAASPELVSRLRSRARRYR
jgi:cyclohexyl-isocyanide hydratase